MQKELLYDTGIERGKTRTCPSYLHCVTTKPTIITIIIFKNKIQHWWVWLWVWLIASSPNLVSSSLSDEDSTRMITSAPGTLAPSKKELTHSSRNNPSLVVGNPGERKS